MIGFVIGFVIGFDIGFDFGFDYMFDFRFGNPIKAPASVRAFRSFGMEC